MVEKILASVSLVVLLYYIYLIWGFNSMIKKLSSEKIGDFLLVKLAGKNQEAILTSHVYNGLYTQFQIDVNGKNFLINPSQVVKNFGPRLSSLKHGGLI